MSNDPTYIWYASYGSNLQRDRFLCYIQGGTPVGSQKHHHGCRDKTLPADAGDLLDLHRCFGSVQRQDLPPIFIDFAARQALGVQPGDCVRVTRDVPRALWSRVYFVTIPTSLAAIELISGSVEGIGWIVVLIIAMASISIVAVFFELRKMLT